MYLFRSLPGLSDFQKPLHASVMIEFAGRAAIPSHVIVRRIADEAVLLNVATEHYYALDSVGYSMLLHSTSGATLADAVDALLNEYEVDREQLVADFTALLNRLLEAGLIEMLPPAATPK